MTRTLVSSGFVIVVVAAAAAAGQQPPPIDTIRGDAMIADYFRQETAKLAEDCLADIRTLDDWREKREVYRQQLLEMLGLDPLPERTDLQPVVTGTVEHEEFTVENLHFQSRRGLYVTGNLFIPRGLDAPAPTILYVCGHSRAKEGDVSYGNKTSYHHHGAWFARHGYVCLVIDTLQLGEIEGIHHGTYRYGMWWWNAHGYTPAGVEAWNCVRALDYLQTRPEVDAERFGVTGRSGGGAYSWWIAAIDERIKVAVPVAGITDLENHVVDGTVEGHCDCMFMVNTYRWDYAAVAALVAPRPLLISNSDKDRIFPLEGVMRIHSKVRDIYRLYNATDNLGLQITEGPHADTQELRVHAFSWFNRFLKDERPLIDKPAVKFFERRQLRVFDQLPEDQRNTEIHETFVTRPTEWSVPQSVSQWTTQRDEWIAALKTKSFRGWPRKPGPLDVRVAFDVEHDGLRLAAYDFTSQSAIRLRMYVLHRANLAAPELIVLGALDDDGWRQWLAQVQVGFAEQLQGETLAEADKESFAQTTRMLKNNNWAMAYLAPRGVGPTAWDQSEKKQIQHRRRFMLLGQTLDGMRVWDLRRGCQVIADLERFRDVPLWLQGERNMAGIALYASLFEPKVARLDLWHLPTSHREGPIFLNVLRYLDIPQAVAMAAENRRVRVYQDDEAGWEYPRQVSQQLGWNEKQLQVRRVPVARDR